MAQLPPKIPNLYTDWPSLSSLPHHRAPSVGNSMPNITQPSWVDDFLDFSPVKRGSHRRSASDSITVLEAPSVEECQSRATMLRTRNNEFGRLDDEQLVSMFSDDVATTVAPMLSSSNRSTSSDHNSINDEKPTLSDQQLQNEPEVQSACKSGPHVGITPSMVRSDGDRIADPKRVKRILANRKSAQRSRVRKLQYVSELERSVTLLQTEVSVLSPRVAFLDHQRLVLGVDNSYFKQRIAALAQDKIFKDAQQEALKKEIERLRQVHHQQNLKEGSSNPSQPQICTDKEAVN